MHENWERIVAWSLLAVLSVSLKAEGTCDPCTNCSADPVFIQKDARNPELVLVSRDLRRMGVDPGAIDSIALVEGASGTGARLVIFQEDGGRVEAQMGPVETLGRAVAAFLCIGSSRTATVPMASPALVNPNAFLRGE